MSWVVWVVGMGVLRRQTNHLPSSSDARTKGSWQIRSKSTRECLIRAQLVPYRPQRGRAGNRRAQHEDADVVGGGGWDRNGRERGRSCQDRHAWHGHAFTIKQVWRGRGRVCARYGSEGDMPGAMAPFGVRAGVH